MEACIAAELQNRRADKIKKLVLDNCQSSTIEGLTSEYTDLVKLSLINVGLTSLENLPPLKKLKKLELAGNEISDGLKNLKSCPNIKKLNLSSNKIKNFKELKPLRKLRKLEILDLYNNDIQYVRNYREKVFYLIPSLKFLDGFNQRDRECPTDNDDGLSDKEEEFSSSDGDMEFEERSWDYDYFDDLPEEKKRKYLKMYPRHESSSNSDSDSSKSEADSDSSSWEDLSYNSDSSDANSSKDQGSSKGSWIDISSEASSSSDDD